MHAHTFTQLTLDRGTKYTDVREDILLNITRKMISPSRRPKLDPCCSHSTKTKSKWSTDLNENLKILQLLECNILETLTDTALSMRARRCLR